MDFTSDMADEAKIGRPWQSDELDVIVADYFEMLADEFAGKPYTKSQHSAALMKRIGRTHRSVEFKHQNISAVLDELGLPWITGYIPKRNYQNAIFDAIDRYLSARPQILQEVPKLDSGMPSLEPIFVPTPARAELLQPIPLRLQRLVMKFDPATRDSQNRALGRAGEQFVVEMEKRKLGIAGKQDLAADVRWVSAIDGDGAGYDIRSFSENGDERFIEVKTTNGGARTPFFLTRNEAETAKEFSDNWCLYRVHLFGRSPRIFTVVPPLENALNLVAHTWKAFL